MRRCRFCRYRRGEIWCNSGYARQVIIKLLDDGHCPFFESAGLSPEAAVDAGLEDCHLFDAQLAGL